MYDFLFMMLILFALLVAGQRIAFALGTVAVIAILTQDLSLPLLAQTLYSVMDNFIWAAIPERTEWKYAYLSARLIAMEAGHVCQNLYLAAGAAGAGCCALLGYDQASVDRLLGVDGRDEFAVYLAAVGVPTKTAP